MIALAFIDQETVYLPDDLTQPLLWLGILVSMQQTLGVDLASVGDRRGRRLSLAVDHRQGLGTR